MIVVDHDRHPGVDIIAMCCYLSPVSPGLADVTVVDMLGRGAGQWVDH